MGVNFNRVIVAGHIVKDPELRETPKGRSVCNFDLAINEHGTVDETGERPKIVTFIRVTTWGHVAERCDKCCKKGHPVLVEGAIRHETWMKDGEKKQRHLIRADRVVFLKDGAAK